MEELLAAIERRTTDGLVPVVVALDGRSGAGKSTIANKLADEVSAVVIASDDFYSGGVAEEWLARTPQQRASHCIDWRRLRREALEPLRAGLIARYHPFDELHARPPVTLEPNPVIILDGAYSGRPELEDIVDIAVLVELPDGERRRRLIKRQGAAAMGEWHATWDEAEEYYFAHVCPPTRFDIVTGCPE